MKFEFTDENGNVLSTPPSGTGNGKIWVKPNPSNVDTVVNNGHINVNINGEIKTVNLVEFTSAASGSNDYSYVLSIYEYPYQEFAKSEDISWESKGHSNSVYYIIVSYRVKMVNGVVQNITRERIPCTLSNYPDWVTQHDLEEYQVQDKSDESLILYGYSLNLAISQNNSGATRTGFILVSNNNGANSFYIHVSQKIYTGDGGAIVGGPRGIDKVSNEDDVYKVDNE